MSAVHSNLMFVQNGSGGQGCGCGCDGRGQAIVFRSVWDRLVHQLFGSIPVGMVAEGQLPDIHIYTNVVLLNDEEPYSFAVITDDGSAPQPHDVIQYKDKFYIIGAVTQQGSSSSGSNSGQAEYQGNTDPGNSGSEGSINNPINPSGPGQQVVNP